jgi:hypothetical protein
MFIMKTSKTVLFHVLALMLTGLMTSRADQQITEPIALPVRVNLTVNETDCSNSRGPWITLSGNVRMNGLTMRVIFQNNVKGTHTAAAMSHVDVTLIPLGESITIPKQPVRGGVGGNPHIWLQLHDGEGNNLTGEYYMGRCVQGLTLASDVVLAALAEVDIHAEDCSNNPGPFITLGGNITMSGLHARIIFRNNVKGTHTAQSQVDVPLINSGMDITIPKQPVLGGVGGNPWIYFQFLDGNGSAMDDPALLGRCVQLSN